MCRVYPSSSTVTTGDSHQLLLFSKYPGNLFSVNANMASLKFEDILKEHEAG